MAIEYEVPEEQAVELRKGMHNMGLAKDILVKLRTAGRPNAEAEGRVREIESMLQRFADAFKVDITPEE